MSEMIEQKMEEFARWWETLDWKQREEVNRCLNDLMCRYCGGPSDCHCWNDE